MKIDTPKDWKAPKWHEAGLVHEWKNHISAEIQAMWGIFSDEQKQVLARQAEESADNEEWD